MARTARKRRKIILGQPGYPRKPIEIKKKKGFLCRSEQAARSTSTANGKQQAKFFSLRKTANSVESVAGTIRFTQCGNIREGGMESDRKCS